MPLCEQTIDSNICSAKTIEDQIIAEVETNGYDEDSIFALRLSLEEALANAIRHGNQGNSHKSIHIAYHITKEFVEIDIADEGDGFSPNRVPDPTSADKLEIPSGRGILLMRAYMDIVEFNDKGNGVHLVKFNRIQPQNTQTIETTGHLDMSLSHYKNHTVLSLAGSADMAETQAFAKVLDHVIDAGKTDLVLDISRLDFVCSMALGIWIKSQSRCRHLQGDLVLASPQPAVMRVLKTTRLNDLFTICPCVQAALKLTSKDAN